MLQGIAGCCSVLQCVVVCCSVLQCVAAVREVSEHLVLAVRGALALEHRYVRVLQRVAACCNVLQGVAMGCSVL